MTFLLADPAPTEAPRDSGDLLVGMPHLALNGLSETWLLKECGHRHWMMLARELGQPVPDFRDRTGATVYATFTAVSTADAALDQVEENDRLRFEGRIERVSRTQFQSTQRIAVGERTVARVTLLSVFLKRAQAGDNRSVVRAVPSRMPLALFEPGAGQGLAGTAYGFRDGSWGEHMGFRREERRILASHPIDPCPHGDFNGAGFLYFASFQGFADRAEWAFHRDRSARLTTARRELFLYGNVNPGDRLTVNLCGLREGGEALDHWLEIVRQSDGSRIADVLSLRRGPE
ncbi:Pnap_2097 family protein [Azospirillum sp. SYSU D00513]|uniref:Pnap_2097 family protein n=1 Tax=Azospirillum sp. SYSU D00513 TaxID=2812561 RepID=UPI001A95A6F3|nr:Pnap_2097 family protein [Azospirillum sp. SYSU D00513]